MVTILILAASLSAQSAPTSHVRTSDARIAALIEAGLAGSKTFRQLVDTLNASDVIVYVETQQARPALGGYLAHTMFSPEGARYLRVSVRTRGADRWLVAVLAHELQHAVEVAEHPEVRDADALDRLFRQISAAFLCEGICTETRAAIDVEATVARELRSLPVVISRRTELQDRGGVPR
jgi:hypothetical protein